MTWRLLLSSSSVNKARFVTARAISMKLGVRIPLGNVLFFYFRDLIYFVASRWPFRKSDLVKLTKFLWEVYSNKTTSYITRVLDLTYFSRSDREVKVWKTLRKLAYFVTIWPRMFYPCVNMYLGTLYIYTGFQIWPWCLAAILEKQLSPITLELMPGSSPNFYHRYIY
jgi:hypothetical protein